MQADMGCLEKLTPHELDTLGALDHDEKMLRATSGYVDHASKHIVLFYMGGWVEVVDFDSAHFRSGAEPDFNQFSLTNYGKTIKLGELEVAAELMLTKVMK